MSSILGGSERFGGEQEVSREVMDLLLISCVNGLGALIKALASSGVLLPTHLGDIYDATSPPLDHPSLWADVDLSFLRDAWDDVMSSARFAAQLHTDGIKPDEL